MTVKRFCRLQFAKGSFQVEFESPELVSIAVDENGKVVGAAGKFICKRVQTGSEMPDDLPFNPLPGAGAELTMSVWVENGWFIKPFDKLPIDAI